MKASIRNDPGKQKKLIQLLTKDSDPEIKAMAISAKGMVDRGHDSNAWLGSLLGSVRETLHEPIPAPGYRERHYKSSWWQLIQSWTRNWNDGDL